VGWTYVGLLDTDKAVEKSSQKDYIKKSESMSYFMDADQALIYLKQLVFEPMGVLVDELTENLVKLAWVGETYETIAKQLGYEESYVRDRGSRLFRLLRQAFEESIGKQNFKVVVERRFEQEKLVQKQLATSPPETNHDFLGREDDLAKLHQCLQDSQVVLIQGEGGLGKTTLARKYLEKYGFRVLPIWMATENPSMITPAENIVEEWLPREFNSPAGRDFGINLSRLRQCLSSSQKPIGILIDNFDSVLNGSGRLLESHRCYLELLRLLADPNLPVVTLITSRERLQESAVTPQIYRLEGLSEGVWRDYFAYHRMDVQPHIVREIWNACGGNPKAMKILKGAAQAEFDGDLDGYWQSCDRNLLIEGTLQDLVCNQFDSIQASNSIAYQLLCRMGAYRYQDVPFVSLAGVKSLLWDVPEPQRQSIIQSLRGRSLIECRRNQKFWLHPMIRSEAIKRLKQSPVEWQEAHRQAAQFWLNSVEVVDTVEDALQALEAYYHYLEIEDYEQACAVIVTQKPNRWNTEIEVGWLFYRLSLLQQMTSAITRIIDHISADRRAGRLYNLLGYMHRLSGEMGDAIANHRIALEIAENLGSIRLKISALFNLGLCHRDLWRSQQAIEYFLQVQRLAQEIHFTDYEIYANCCLAYLFSRQGDRKMAITYANTVSPIMLQEQVTSWGAGCSLLYLANTYRNLGELEAATELYQDTLIFAQNNQFTHIAAKAIGGLAQVDSLRKNYPQALARHDTAIDRLQQINAQCDLAEAYLQRGLTYRAMQQTQSSHQDFQRSRQLFLAVESYDRLAWLEEMMEDV
jgi:tetratricopeptide (TPR) repeat protein